jgi:hypothetical protein
MLGTLGFKLDEGVIKRLNKIQRFSNQAKGSVELIIDYLLMKRSLLSHKVKSSEEDSTLNEIRTFLQPGEPERGRVVSREDDYALLMVDEEAKKTLTRKIYDMCHKVSNICKIIVSHFTNFMPKQA